MEASASHYPVLLFFVGARGCCWWPMKKVCRIPTEQVPWSTPICLEQRPKHQLICNAWSRALHTSTPVSCRMCLQARQNSWYVDLYSVILNLCFKEQHDRLLRCGISLAWHHVCVFFALGSTSVDKHLTVFCQHSHVARRERSEVAIDTWLCWGCLLPPENVADGPWRKFVGFPLRKCREAHLFVLNRGQTIRSYAMPGAERYILTRRCRVECIRKFEKFMTLWSAERHVLCSVLVALFWYGFRFAGCWCVMCFCIIVPISVMKWVDPCPR